MTKENNMNKIVSLCKRRGFIFQGSEIYGGLANSFDYAPLGVQLKQNLKNLWWKTFVQKRRDIVGLDSSIIMNKKVWEASGHINSFTDPLVDCKECKNRFRADHLGDDYQCPTCKSHNWTTPKNFNLMFKTHQGVSEETANEVYLRPETAQGIFINFSSVQQTMRKKLPFGIAQIGKAFRNEITPGNFIFRTREFEQMEIEYFFNPKENKWEELFEKWKKDSWDFMTKKLGLKKENLKFRDHDKDELSHYSKGTTDIEYNFPFGWGELAAAVAYRTDYDITQHQNHSKKDLFYLDPKTNEKVIPHVLEPSYGADRLTLAVLLDAYTEETLEDNTTRIVLKLNFDLAPNKFAVLPLMKKDGLSEKALEIFEKLSDKYMCDYDEGGAIGKRYRRQDEIGTPFCLTIDYETLENNTITIRNRDNMKQERIKIDCVEDYINENKF